MIALCSCMTKEQKNQSLINGYWVRETKPNSNVNFRMFPVLYFDNENVLSTGTGISNQYSPSELSAKFTGDNLEIIVRKGKSKRSLHFSIVELNVQKLVLRAESGEIHVYHRKFGSKKNRLDKIAVGYSGLQPWNIEVGEDLNCSIATNREKTYELFESKIPLWKWKAIQFFIGGIELKSVKEKIDKSIMCCGGDFSMAVKTQKGNKYIYIQPDNVSFELRMVTETIWGLLSNGIEKGNKTKGQLELSDELEQLCAFQIPEEQKTLRFVPPVIK